MDSIILTNSLLYGNKFTCNYERMKDRTATIATSGTKTRDASNPLLVTNELFTIIQIRETTRSGVIISVLFANREKQVIILDTHTGVSHIPIACTSV